MSQLIGVLLAAFFIWLRFESDTYVPMPRRDLRWSGRRAAYDAPSASPST